jgi:membrane-associated phospholipid phosphatase
MQHWTLFATIRWFLLGFFVFALAGGFLLVTVDKSTLHLTINSVYSPILDAVFVTLTALGDGRASTILVIVFLFIRFRVAIHIAGSSIAGLIVTQTLKYTLFADALRPKIFFEHSHMLRFVPGVEIFSYNSFPSGHAVTALATCFCLAVHFRRAPAQILLLILAILIAFSRVYLSQHFFGDIYAGAWIGLFCGAGAAALLGVDDQRPSRAWMDRSLRSYFGHRRSPASQQ